jgi:hypothetical protein
MRVVTVTAKEKFLFDLLTSMQTEELILQTTEGRQFALLSLDEWQGFEIGNHDDFEQEVQATATNRELLAFLVARRSAGPRVPLAKVKQQLGLD